MSLAVGLVTNKSKAKKNIESFQYNAALATNDVITFYFIRFTFNLLEADKIIDHALEHKYSKKSQGLFNVK